MNNIKKIFIAMIDPSDNPNLTSTTFRVALYGFLLSGILYLNSQRFDATELVSVITFTAITTIVEVVLKRLEVGKRLIWSFASLLLLIGFISLMLVQATEFREAWYRVNVVDTNIIKLTMAAPIPIISANSQGFIENLNDKAVELTGWTNMEAKGKSVEIFMRPEKIRYHKEAFKQTSGEIQQSGDPKWVDTNGKTFVIKRKDGSLVKTNIEILGFPFKPKNDTGVYPPGREVEFFAFIIRQIED